MRLCANGTMMYNKDGKFYKYVDQYPTPAAWNRSLNWYYNPLADWCRRTKVNSPYNKFYKLRFSMNSLVVVGETGNAIEFSSPDGERWGLKTIRFTSALRTVLWLFGFRRVK